MPAERRPVEEIRREMAGERAQLEEALADLRRGVDAKRRPAAAIVGVLVAVFVAVVIAKIARRLARG